MGATGIAGGPIVDQLLDAGWPAAGLARRPGPERDGLRWLAADLTSTADLARVLAAERPIHHLGPFEAYGQSTMPDTPFHEDEPRLDVANFYYAQEDATWRWSPT